MKRFLLFDGSTYYPVGGFCDFVNDFDSEDEAKAAAHKRCEGGRIWEVPDWHQIVDTAEGIKQEGTTKFNRDVGSCQFTEINWGKFTQLRKESQNDD